MVSSIFCGIDSRVGPSKLEIQAMVRPGKTPEEVEGLISEEVARFLSSPVTEKELERTRASILRSAVAPRESVLSTAITLADNTALYNDPNRINTEYQKRSAVTAAEIQKAAQAYLRSTNRVVIFTQPAGMAASRPAPPKQN